MPDKTSIVFISHDSSITGAPILLLNLLRLINDTARYSIQIILMRGGDLEDAYKKIGPTLILKPASYSKAKSLFKKLLNYAQYRAKLRTAVSIASQAGIVFNNTVANGSFIKELSPHVKIISYVHELESVIKNYPHAAITFKLSALILCPSQAVQSNLAINHGVSRNNTAIFPYYFLPMKETAGSPLKSIVNFPGNYIQQGKFYVAGMGTATIRKGIDLFVEVCHKATKVNPQIIFIWIGDFVDQEMKESILEKIRNYGLQKNLIITGFVPPDPMNLQSFDLFFLSSREDPYPLVVLEAARLNIPAICFHNTGGISEFILPDAGWTIQDLDTSLAAEKILEISVNTELLNHAGIAAGKKVRAVHENGPAVVEAFDGFIDQVLNT